MRVPDRNPAGPTRAAAIAALVLAAWCAPAPPAMAADQTRRSSQAVRGGGESQIDESAPDEAAPPAGRQGAAGPLAERVRAYVEGSLERYDALKSEKAGFRRQGWLPSFFLRDPDRDVAVEPGPGGKSVVTVHISYARRDLEQRLVIGPAERFELPDADRFFFAEVLGGLAALAPEIGRARVRFWFGVLRADGQMMWESRGGISLTADAARRFPAGARTVEAIWPLLDENTLVWDGRR